MTAKTEIRVVVLFKLPKGVSAAVRRRYKDGAEWISPGITTARMSFSETRARAASAGVAVREVRAYLYQTGGAHAAPYLGDVTSSVLPHA